MNRGSIFGALKIILDLKAKINNKEFIKRHCNEQSLTDL
jgi:hypothetical protein